MTESHRVFQFVSGDDWEIQATLYDENGDPYDLTGPPTIKWALLDAAEQRVLDVDDVTISIVDPLAGRCSIIVPAIKTTALAVGQYTDVLRIVAGGITSTLSYGAVFVSSDPWKTA